jgi:RNA polymerase sigma-70 factor (ECF subfamily)
MSDPTQALLGELTWLRALARRLARDPGAADDLVQDACAIALQQREPPRSWRAWLASVLPHLAAARRRRDTARTRREHEAASPPPAGDDAARVVERAETQHRLAAAVLGLAEPYRTTVLLRFFEQLPPRAIARRLQVPVATVHSRLQRALEQLRTGLDGEFGGRRQWLAALAPIAWPTSLAPTAVGIVLMNTNSKALAAAAVLACSVPLWWPAAGPADAPPEAARVARDADRAAGSGGPTADATAGGRREATPLPAPVAAGSAGTAAASFAVAGRVCDCRGHAVAGVPITADGGGEVARSGPDGTFAFALPREQATLAAAGDRHVTVLGAHWTAAATIAPVVVVADAIVVAGRVVTASGAPVAGSDVGLQLPDDFDTRFPFALDRAGARRFAARTGPDGMFALPRLPAIDGARLLATADAFAPATVPLPAADEPALQLVLAPFRYTGGELRGLVVDAGGTPVPGARVAMGVTSVASGADGTFALSLKRAGWPTAITAAKAGHRPARVEIPRSGGADASSWPDPLVLRLGAAPRSVRGRVVDAAGNAIAGAEVWIADPTPLGIAGLLPLQLEYLIAGGPVPPQASRMRVPHADEPTHDGEVTTQASVVAEPTACWFWVTTDASGVFELPGLLDRTYSLRALDVRSGCFAEAAEVAGDTWRELVIARDDVWPELRGRVVSLRGDGIGGVQVRQQLTPFRHRARVPGGHFEGRTLRLGALATTAPDGTFVLRDVGRRHCTLTLGGDAIVPTAVAASSIGDPAACVLTAEARCHVEVVLQDPSEANVIACRDRDGRSIDVAVLRHDGNRFMTDLPLHDGRSGLFVVGERAATLLLRRGDAVVRTIPFTPDPARTTVLQ